MNLRDYPTPLTDEAERAESVSGYVDADFTRDLEQKLSACRATLEGIRQISKDGPTIIRSIAQKALTLTSPAA